MSDSPASTPSTLTAEHEAVIQEIARTNQITLPWEELREILQNRLCRVLESGQLEFTASSVTNPLTTTIAPVSGSTSSSTAPFSFLNLPGPSPLTHSATSPTATSSIPATEEEGKQRTEGEKTSISTNVSEQQEHGSEGAKGSDSERKEVDETAVKEPKESSTDQVQQNEESITEQKDEQTASSPSASGEVSTEGDNDRQDTALAGSAVLISKDTLLLETPEGYHDRIKGLLNTFTSAPFTIQRVCELLSKPTEHHSSVIKYLRAVEKVLMITSSINEFSNPAYSGQSALDEDTSETAAVEKESLIANGDSDYGRARDLDFSLITSMPNVDAAEAETRDRVLDEDEDVTSSFLEEREVTSRESKSDEGEEEEDAEEAETREMQTKYQDEQNQGGIGSDMDVDAAGGGSTMEGVETGGEDDLQPESSKGDNPMDVDQA